MTVICKVKDCPYRSKNGFCRNRVLPINESGFCGHIYDRNNNIKPNWRQPISEVFMQGYRPKETESIAELDDKQQKDQNKGANERTPAGDQK